MGGKGRGMGEIQDGGYLATEDKQGSARRPQLVSVVLILFWFLYWITVS